MERRPDCLGAAAKSASSLPIRPDRCDYSSLQHRLPAASPSRFGCLTTLRPWRFALRPQPSHSHLTCRGSRFTTIAVPYMNSLLFNKLQALAELGRNRASVAVRTVVLWLYILQFSLELAHNSPIQASHFTEDRLPSGGSSRRKFGDSTDVHFILSLGSKSGYTSWV